MHRASLQPIRTRRLATTPIATPSLPRSRKLSPASPTTRKTLGAIGALWLAFAAAAHAVAPADSAPPMSAKKQSDPILARGRYLVEHVGLCADCHSPRNEQGNFIRTHWLQGAALPFKPTVPMPWSPVAPPIAGLPGLTEAQAITLLQTGKRPDGSTPLPPMPEFRLNQADASAVVAYLKSLAR